MKIIDPTSLYKVKETKQRAADNSSATFTEETIMNGSTLFEKNMDYDSSSHSISEDSADFEDDQGANQKANPFSLPPGRPIKNHAQCNATETDSIAATSITNKYDEEAIEASPDASIISNPDKIADTSVLPPKHRSLLYRHRTPSNASAEPYGSPHHHPALLIRQQINRIRENSSLQTQHAVPVPERKVRSSTRRVGSSSARVVDSALNLVTTDHVPVPQAVTADNHHPPPPPPPPTPPSGEKKKKRLQFKNFQRAFVNYAEQFKPFRTCNSFKMAYTLRSFARDIMAGVGVAIMEIPLSMSYAKLAGLPAYFGLYACFVPALIYPIFGTSRQLSVGPAALVSLLVGAGIPDVLAAEGLDDEESQDYVTRYNQLAIQCAFLSGIIFIGMGLLRLGFIAQFLSKPLISGFTSGAAVLITCTQLKLLFGYNIPASNTIQDIIKHLVENIDKFNWKTFVIGGLCLAFLMSLKFMSSNEYLLQRSPGVKWLKALGPILITVIMIIVTYALNLGDRGIPVVQPIPPGLPAVTIDWWTPIPGDLVIVVLSSVIISFVQAIAVAKKIAYKRGYDVESSQELISLGLANLVGAMFQSYPATGAIAQSAVADDIGAETGVASCTRGLVVMVVLLFLTEVFQHLPLAVLGAIVIASVSSLIDYQEAVYLFHVHFFDFAVWMVALFGTLFMGVEYGLVIAVVLSLVFVIYESAYPKMATLGRLPGTSLYRNVKQYPLAERYDGVLIIRIDAPMYFANAQNIRDRVRKYKNAAMADLKERNAGELRYIIFDLSPMSHIDTTALHVVEDMYMTQRKEGVQICFCDPGMRVVERFVVTGFVDLVGREHFFSAVIDAVQFCLTDMESHVH